MEWNNKVEMIKFLNQGKDEMFYQFVLNHVDEFDAQAWYIFINVLNFDLKNKNLEEFIKKIYPIWKKVEDKMLPNMGFREVPRWVLFEMIATDTLIDKG